MTATIQRVRRATPDPLAVYCWIGILLLALAFVSFLAAWMGSSRTTRVDVQVAYLVSGGLAGVALLTAGSGLLTVQLTRLLAARERRELEAVITAARSALPAD